MLLLLVLSTAAIFTPTLSHPTRYDGYDDTSYPFSLLHDRSEWGQPEDWAYRGVDIGHLLRDLEAARLPSWYDRQRRNSKLGDPLGIQLFGTSKRFDPMSIPDLEKRNFDEIDRAGFNFLTKRNFDEIDRAGFNSFAKREFDEIDRSGFDEFSKRMDYKSDSSKGKKH